MKRMILLLMTAMLMAASSQAAEVSVSQALSTAQKFVNQPSAKFCSGKGGALKLAHEARSVTGKPDYYVFNLGEGDGFIVVSGEDRVQSVWGYCDHGKFDFDKMPDNVKWWFGEYQRQMQFLREHSDVQVRSRVTLSNGVGPLMTTQWDQCRPFNDMCPEAPSRNDTYLIYGGRACTGCGAVAMAQILRYHQWPRKGSRTYSYDCGVKYYDPETGELITNNMTLSTDLSQSVYQWDLMKDQYLYKDMNNYGYFDENMHIYIKVIDENGDTVPDVNNIHGNAVAKLISDVGITVKMQYGSSEIGSGAFISNVYYSLRDYFDYSVNYYERDNWYGSWDALLRNQIDAGHPIYYAGRGSGAHAFVIDGYDTEGRFHLNWGWGGDYDGYFETLALNPGNHNYSSEHKVVFCSPNKPTTPMLYTSVADGENIDFDMAWVGNVPVDVTHSVRVYGMNLRQDVTVSLEGDDAAMFETVATLPQDMVNTSAGYTLDVHYKPTVMGQHTAQLVINVGNGVEPVTLNLTGTAYLYYDVNKDGVIGIADVTDLIDQLLAGEIENPAIADVDLDGLVGISDVRCGTPCQSITGGVSS